MAAKGSHILAIELGSEHLRVLYGVSDEPGVKVLDFATEELLDPGPDSARHRLEALLRRKRFGSSLAAIALSGPGILHRVLSFPPMPRRELALVMQREISAVEGVSAEDAIFDWEVMEEDVPGKLEEVHVLLAIAPKGDVESAGRLLETLGLRPVLLTTAPVALLRALRLVAGGGRGFQALLRLSAHQSCLLGVRDGVWNFYREFFSQTSGDEGDGLFGEALREVNRALLYQRQKYPEGAVMSVLVSGDKGLSELGTRLKEAGVLSELVRPNPNLDLKPLGERANLFAHLFPSFLVPLGLLSAVSLDQGINLLPRGRRLWLWRPRLSFSWVSRPVAACVGIVLVVALHLLLMGWEARYERLLEKRKTLHDQWLPAIRAGEERKALEERLTALQQALGLQRTEESWVFLFKTISRIVPPDLVLQTLTAERDKEKGLWVIALKGEVVAGDTYLAQAHFNRFYQGLKRSLVLEEIDLLPLRVTTVKENVAGPVEADEERPPGKAAARDGRPKAVEVTRTRVEFDVRLHAREI